MMNPKNEADVLKTFEHLHPGYEITRCYWAFEGDFRIIARPRLSAPIEERWTTEYHVDPENHRTLIGFRKI